jgi:hypothetical protein
MRVPLHIGVEQITVTALPRRAGKMEHLLDAAQRRAHASSRH